MLKLSCFLSSGIMSFLITGNFLLFCKLLREPVSLKRNINGRRESNIGRKEPRKNTHPNEMTKNTYCWSFPYSRSKSLSTCKRKKNPNYAKNPGLQLLFFLKKNSTQCTQDFFFSNCKNRLGNSQPCIRGSLDGSKRELAESGTKPALQGAAFNV